MNFSIYTMLVLFQFCIYFHVVVFLYIGCRFLLCTWLLPGHLDPLFTFLILNFISFSF